MKQKLTVRVSSLIHIRGLALMAGCSKNREAQAAAHHDAAALFAPCFMKSPPL